jgi:hypothetical protein
MIRSGATVVSKEDGTGAELADVRPVRVEEEGSGAF